MYNSIMNKSKYLLTLTIPLSVFFSFQGGLFSYLGLFYAFGVIPFLELFLSSSKKNLDDENEKKALDDLFFDVLAWLMVPIQYGLMGYYCYVISLGVHNPYEIVGMTLSMGTACGVLGINVGHELGHRTTWIEQKMALALLLTSQYMHFFIEHNRIHHKYVSTPDDPASAMKGQTLYNYFPQTIFGSWFSCFKLDRSTTLLYLGIQISFLVAIGLVFGVSSMVGALVSGIFGFLLLETVNYIEHYGLRRKKNESTGRYEKVQPKHSWNSNHPIGRLVLFELSRHSDHHANARRKYQTLRHFDEAPEMPTGYPGMMILSLFPPLWFKVMDPLVEKTYQNSETI